MENWESVREVDELTPEIMNGLNDRQKVILGFATMLPYELYALIVCDFDMKKVMEEKLDSITTIVGLCEFIDKRTENLTDDELFTAHQIIVMSAEAKK